MRDTEREAETQAEREAGSMQGARCGTQPWVSRIRPWAEGSAKLLSHPGSPHGGFLSRELTHTNETTPTILPTVNMS